MVYLFRLSARCERSLLGWAALDEDRRQCLAMAQDGPPQSHAIGARRWFGIEHELAQSLPTRPLPEASAIYQALAPAVADRCSVEYVACVHGEALPDLSAALYWLDRASP